MKILHTADWHIGKKLHKHELSKDFDLFTDWLQQLITSEKIELLLISGDVFDLANPSSEARKQYYSTLTKLRSCNCKIIITGGNHDSPAMLDAPKEILRELDVHIIGGLPQNLEETIIPIYNSQGEVELLIAAIPFLRDSDLRTANDGYTYEDRLEAIRSGIKNTFKNAANICEEKHSAIPIIAMGHLFTAGMESSDSERDIQIGNQAAFYASHFGDCFNYIALGHIHKPQRVTANVPAFYSGSPLPLSFTERKDEKRVLLLDTNIGFEPKSIAVPNFRKLLRFSGDLSELRQKLEFLEPNTKLAHLVEVELKEEYRDVTKIYEFDQLIQNFDKPGYVIVKQWINFTKEIKGAGELYKSTQQLEDLQPKEVFQKLINDQQFNAEELNEVLSAFDELLEVAHHNLNLVK